MKKNKTSDKVDEQLERLDILEAQFNFYTQETLKLDKQVVELDESTNLSYEAREKKLLKIHQVMEELYARYKRDIADYENLIKEIDLYFKTKYHIDLKLSDFNL